jgi:hypothetical protein
VSVVSLSLDALGFRLLVTLSIGLSLEVSIDTGHALVVSEGHGPGGIALLATHPTDPDTAFTVGCTDRTLKVWALDGLRPSSRAKVS